MNSITAREKETEMMDRVCVDQSEESEQISLNRGRSRAEKYSDVQCPSDSSVLSNKTFLFLFTGIDEDNIDKVQMFSFDGYIDETLRFDYAFAIGHSPQFAAVGRLALVVR